MTTPATRCILNKIFERWRMLPEDAASGAEGLKKMEQAFAEGRPYGLVLVDQHMPGMDGFAVLRTVRAEESLRDTPIMMLTSGDQSAARARCLESGVGICLLKPVKPSLLLTSGAANSEPARSPYAFACAVATGCPGPIAHPARRG